jgi:hypothetical protein
LPTEGGLRGANWEKQGRDVPKGLTSLSFWLILALLDHDKGVDTGKMKKHVDRYHSGFAAQRFMPGLFVF